MKKTRNVLVTGSSGFIGKHLMASLNGCGVPFDIRKNGFMDVNNAENLKSVIQSFKPKAIVHLAAISNRKSVDNNPELALKTNIIGTFNVLRIAKKYGVRVILASSAAVEVPELSLYGVTKDAMEKIADMFDNAVIARFYNVYGSKSKSVVNKFVDAALKGKEVVLNGNTTRDYVHVDDVVDKLLSLIDAPQPPHLVEIGTGRAITLNKLVSLVQKETNSELKTWQGEEVREIQHSLCGNKYGQYKVTLEQGIRRLISE